MKKLLAISLSLFMLFSGMGLTFATHYCQGAAVKSGVRLGKAALNCGMQDETCQTDNRNQQNHINSIPCCKNEFAELNLDTTCLSKITFNSHYTDLSIFFPKIQLQSICFIKYFKQTILIPDDTPLLPASDIIVFIGSFLI